MASGEANRPRRSLDRLLARAGLLAAAAPPTCDGGRVPAVKPLRRKRLRLARDGGATLFGHRYADRRVAAVGAALGCPALFLAA